MKKQRTQRYIIMPSAGITTKAEINPKVANFLVGLSAPAVEQASVRLNIRNRFDQPDEQIQMNVLDSVSDDGPKLIAMDDAELAKFHFSYPGLRVIPEVFYELAYARPSITTVANRSAAAITVNITVTGPEDEPVEDADVLIFTDFDAEKGGEGVTGDDGKTRIRIDGTNAERIYIYAKHTYWSAFLKNVSLLQDKTVKLTKIDFTQQDSLRYFYETATFTPLKNKIRIGIVDTGVGPHPDVPLSGGKNLVTGEPDTDYTDTTEGHGTHVAGIIAGIGALKGVSVGAELMSYRVFPRAGTASNFYIMNAINQAVTDGCDLINLSVKINRPEPALVSAIDDAYNAGVLCFAATGNDHRGPVTFPASHNFAIGVAAMGRKGTFPANTSEADSVQKPFGSDKDNFIPDFCNTGPETDLVAPGVGIVSTFPNGEYAVMDGTSMACPAAAGIAARLLDGRPDLLNLPRNQTRADEIMKFLSQNIKTMGFGVNFEGKGMLIL